MEKYSSRTGKEGVERAKDLDARVYFIWKRAGGTPFCEKNLPAIKRCIFEGILFGFPRGRLGPPEHNRVELTTFA